MKPTQSIRPIESRLTRLSEPPTIWTSSFKVAGRQPNAICIARGMPNWYHGEVYDPLRPSRELLNAVCSSDEWDRRYATEVLAPLDPIDVLEALAGKIALCWEWKPRDRCHRHQVAEWLLKTTGVRVNEWTESDSLQMNLLPS